MGYAGKPNQQRGLIIGMIGGAIGAQVAWLYRRQLLPSFLPEIDAAPTGSPADDPLEARALAHFYTDGETVNETIGRVGYEMVYQQPPTDEQRVQSARIAALVIGALLGGAYGSTRNTTRARDFAGGIFYGVRLWIGELTVGTLIGLRPGFTRQQPNGTIGLLTVWVVFSFVTANTTRLLYWLLFPADRPENQRRRQRGWRGLRLGKAVQHTGQVVAVAKTARKAQRWVKKHRN